MILVSGVLGDGMVELMCSRLQVHEVRVSPAR